MNIIMRIKQILLTAFILVSLSSFSQIEYTRTVESFDNISFLVKIRLKKGDITGTSKVQEEINPGYAIEVLTGANASSSYQENVIKLIWENIPADTLIELEYLASPSNNKVNKLEINGYFLYIKGDKVHKYTSTPTYFTLEENTIAMYDPKKIEEPTETEGITDKDVIPEHLRKKEVKEVLAVRDFSEKPAETATEELAISEDIGETESEELFTNTDDSALDTPIENEIEISEEAAIDMNSDTELADNLNIIEDDITEEAVVTNKNLETGINETTNTKPEGEISPEEKVIENATIESNGVEIKAVEFTGETVPEEETTTTTTEEVIPTEEAENTVDVATNLNKPTETATSAPSEADLSTEQTAGNNDGIYYKVQICALRPKNEVEASYFNKKYNLTDEISKEDHEGWKKYTVQKYTVYKDARDARNNVINNHAVNTGAFVTAYNNGVRIHVREALDATNQKWYR